MSSKQRIQRNNTFDQLAVIALQGQGWISSVSLAGQVGVKYRPLAFALRRLVSAGYAEERLVEYRGTARSKEYRREYRLLTHPPAGRLITPE